VGLSEDKKRALHAVLAISERLDLPTIAAGVETLEEHGTLRELGCSTAQGFLFAPPANASDTTLWLKEREASENRPSTAQIRRVK
jgi:EAL domain-containing protein (putative c-di-GMP-specific phosphodiesterase class I)